MSAPMGTPRPGAPDAGLTYGSYLAEVVSVNDPDSKSRVQVRLLGFDGMGEQDAPMWARVAVPFAGAGRGAFFIPSKGDEVVVQFVNGDPRQPLVLGGVWNGNAQAPETLGGSKEAVDRWTIVGKAGTRIAIVEEQSGEEKITLTTPQSQVSAELTQSSGGKIELKAAQCTVTIDSQGVTVETASKVSVKGSTVEIQAGSVTVNAGISKFSGLVKCDTLQATTVIATTYTPGAGNVW
jgi:uncharacterized protein involved in type VI secretion and phage assembly